MTATAPRRWRRRLLLLAGSLGVALVVAEVAARLALRKLNTMPRPAPAAGRETLLVDMIQAAGERDVVYELRPHLDCVFQGVRVTTDAHGFRGAEVALAKPPGTFRVLGLGDSVLFGWGVEQAETGASLLEQRLRVRPATPTAEVLCTGVPGYNTVMEAAFLRARGVAFAPDVVLVDFVGNDFDLPNFLLAPADFWRLDHCYLYDLALRVWRSDWLDPRTPFVWAPGDGQGHFESDPARVPAAYRHLVGPAAFRRALEAVAGLGRDHGFRVLVTTHGRLLPPAAAACAEFGLPIVELGPRVDAWLAEHHTQRYVGSPLTVAADDPHPSAIQHAMWAEAVYARLDELGWLPR
ncbi:MAG: SGNH/GDSL hydrolase family protein [Planctomycetota bacterium]